MAALAIATLTWNDAERTEAWLGRLLPGEWAGVTVVVADNGSRDDAVERIRAWARTHGVDCVEERDRFSAAVWPEAFVLLRSSANLGWAQGVNTVIGAVLTGESPEHVLLANNDAEIASAEVQGLVAAAQRSGAAITGAVVVEGRREHAGERWPLDLFSYGLATRRHAAERASGYVATDGFHGAVALLRTSFLRRQLTHAGHVYDPALFMYWDEMDLARSAAAQGEEIVIARNVRVAHARDRLQSAGPTYRYYYRVRNRVRVARKWLPRWAAVPFVAYESVRVVLVSGIRASRRASRLRARAELAGLVDALRGVSGKWVHHDRG